MQFDVIIVGAGPAGLSAAIRLKQLAQQHDHALSVCVLEKGSEVGAHILSGAVLEPSALTELFPDWQTLGAPVTTPVVQEELKWLTKRWAIPLPVPKPMKNTGNYLISLGKLCRWLAQQAEQLGVEIYPGFAAKTALYNEHNEVIGVITGATGLNKQGEKTDNYQPGLCLEATYTLLAEGCRGSLTKELINRFNLQSTHSPQIYGLGIKEIWEFPQPVVPPGTVLHTIGWPLDQKIYGGSFLYAFSSNQLAVGLVVGLDYSNPYLDPFAEMQRWKTHPAIRPYFAQGRRISYGARTLVEGGWQALPQLAFPGGLLIGDAAGFLNVPKIKGIHTAMKSGMLAAESVFAELKTSSPHRLLPQYAEQIKQSWLGKELIQARNIRPAFRHGLWLGLAYSAIDTYLLQGRAPWTFKHRVDHRQLLTKHQAKPIPYPAPDGQLTFDKLASLPLSNVHHEEDQPNHLQLRDPAAALTTNYQVYASPEQHYCPAKVYELHFATDKQPQLVINAANCLHCKACDIKDPQQNITWSPPEGGGGPNYESM